MAPVFIIAFLCLVCLGLAGFCVWKMSGVVDKLRQAMERDQQYRMTEREAAFRREKFFIAVLLKNDPQLADAISKLAPDEQMRDLDFMTNLPGVGEVMCSRKIV